MCIGYEGPLLARSVIVHMIAKVCFVLFCIVSSSLRNPSLSWEFLYLFLRFSFLHFYTIILYKAAFFCILSHESTPSVSICLRQQEHCSRLISGDHKCPSNILGHWVMKLVSERFHHSRKPASFLRFCFFFS